MGTKLNKVDSKFKWYAGFFLSLFLFNIDPLITSNKRNLTNNPYYNSKMNNPNKPNKRA